MPYKFGDKERAKHDNLRAKPNMSKQFCFTILVQINARNWRCIKSTMSVVATCKRSVSGSESR